ncbi:MAG TPA: hypothetical protein VNA30_04425 [Mycobacteriales bacterium]|nr:hypothetical protein [Mycobacteriales bacterium]
MRARWLVTTLLLIPLVATTGHAAPTKVPQVKDPAGDAVAPRPGVDIVSVLYTTAGTGSGKKYVPKKFLVTMTLAGPVELGPGLTYEVEAATDRCGDVTFTYEPGTPYGAVTGRNGWADWGNCLATDGTESVELLAPNIKGNTISWEFSVKAIDVKVGTVFTDFRARVDPSNPVVPFPSSLTQSELGLIDAATGKGSWKLT